MNRLTLTSPLTYWTLAVALLCAVTASGSLATSAWAQQPGSAVATEECGYSGCHGGAPLPGTEASGTPVPQPPVPVTLSRPAPTGRARARKAFTIRGTISAAHYSASTVTLELSRKSGKRWVARRTVTAQLAAGSSRYSARVRLPARGTWRVRASHADEGHTPSKSGYRTFRVR